MCPIERHARIGNNHTQAGVRVAGSGLRVCGLALRALLMEICDGSTYFESRALKGLAEKRMVTLMYVAGSWHSAWGVRLCHAAGQERVRFTTARTIGKQRHP